MGLIAKESREAWKRLYQIIDSGELKEDEFWRAAGLFAKKKANGELDGWGMPGFIRHLDRFKSESANTGTIYLVCEGCKEQKKIKATARNDNRHCSLCSGRLILADDQCGLKTIDEWRRPANEELPTIDQLETIYNAQAKRNPSLARLVRAQIDSGSCRKTPKDVPSSHGADRGDRSGYDDPFDF